MHYQLPGHETFSPLLPCVLCRLINDRAGISMAFQECRDLYVTDLCARIDYLMGCYHSPWRPHKQLG